MGSPDSGKSYFIDMVTKFFFAATPIVTEKSWLDKSCKIPNNASLAYFHEFPLWVMPRFSDFKEFSEGRGITFDIKGK